MKKRTYDRERLTPAVKCSICTGEKAAGFLDKSTGRFTEVLLIRSDRDLARFMKQYGVTEPPETIY